MDDKMTVTDALKATINLLNSIAVPRYLNESIGVPIDNAANNIRACVDAMEKAKEDQDGNSNAL